MARAPRRKRLRRRHGVRPGRADRHAGRRRNRALCGPDLPRPDDPPGSGGDSEGNRAAFDADRLVEELERLESGEGSLETTTFPTLTAYKDGEELDGSFRALNEVSVHHSSPVLAATFDVRTHDNGRTREFRKVIGDGMLVATPFGSTGYYRAITGGTFTEGFGVAFNNVHKPRDVPLYAVLSEEAVVEVELRKTRRSSGAVLTRDDDEPYELAAGESVEIRAADRTVDLVTVA
ncbi:MAG: hypothetical protein ACOCPZ_00800 [Natrialbaceae archaeon]